ncbi:beta-ketoacyl-[acyl-carrier-protein] synthase family protein [Allorhizocola rhizosphaerae]|uniref:beta-ketoacyl-[acyl-carrier-protein] synthase family protein n=1 Tax=Allorhizocola rhizosphaerae TaxID=1872709 RepID=UPI000E3BD0E4|nr:beta-ketoacyl-[acyl-carrier-protein] synthase family protein [Allorhizocola rhizosphaerae]
MDSSQAGRRSVVISGMGMMLPGAYGVAQSWDALHRGRSQCGWLTRCDPDETGVPFAAQLDDASYRRYLPDLEPEKAAKHSREMLVVIAAIQQARQDAGLSPGAVSPDRVAVVAASSRGPAEWWQSLFSLPRSSQRPGASRVLRGLPGAPASMAAIQFGFRGLVTTFSSACVSGNHALDLALRLLQTDTADAVFVVGHEFPLVPWLIREWAAAGDGVIARSGDDPARAVRPYDRHRQGFVLGEGAVALCLERAAQVRSRGGRGYAAVLGVRSGNEAQHPTSMDKSGNAAAQLMRDLLHDIGRKPSEIGYVCGHGTATQINDLAESRALMILCEGIPESRWPPLGSVKPIFGHLMGAASLVNVAGTALMLHHQTLAPTINCDAPDPACAVDHVIEGSRATSFDLALSMSYALGSQMSAVALSATDDDQPRG